MSAMRTTVRRFGMVTTFEAIRKFKVASSKFQVGRRALNFELATLNFELVGAAQREQRDFRQTAVAHGQYDRAEAARDIDLCLSAAAEAAQDASAHAARGRALGAPCDLPAVRVAREH